MKYITKIIWIGGILSFIGNYFVGGYGALIGLLIAWRFAEYTEPK